MILQWWIRITNHWDSSSNEPDWVRKLAVANTGLQPWHDEADIPRILLLWRKLEQLCKHSNEAFNFIRWAQFFFVCVSFINELLTLLK